MKRIRVKLVGLGLAVLGGSAVADDWQQTGPPAAPVRPAGARMPAEPDPVNPIWLPAAPRPVASPVVPAQLPELGPPQSLPLPTPAAEQTLPARTITLPPGSLPVIPVPPEQDAPPPRAIPPIPRATEVWRGRSASTQPIEPPRQVEEKPKPMPQPTPPGEPLGRPRPVEDMLPPRPVTPEPPAAEWPVAPAELMVPAGAAVPGKHGAFGSPPIKLGRDYPSLADLCPSVFGDKAAADEEPIAAPRGFIAGEYLMWWVTGMHVPILATTNPNPRRFGFLGEPGTVPILGPGTFLDSFRQGVRVRGGWWFDDCGSCGIDGSVFVLGRRTAEATFASEEFPVVTRPIFSPNPFPGRPGVVVGEFGQAVSVPGVLHGAVSAQADSFLWGADANLRKCLYRDCNTWATWFVGYRNVNLQESLSITENIAVIGASPRIPDPVGTMIRVLDRFATENHFNGGQIGATAERRWGAFSLDARGSVAFGVTDQELSIFGAQTRTRPGQLPVTYSGGLLAAGPNLGTFHRDQFSVVPEFTLNLGYYVIPNLKMYVGYNFLYWTNVLRPGDQIDPVVDLTFVPNAPAVAPSGQNRPQPLFRQSDLLVTGLQFGVEFRW